MRAFALLAVVGATLVNARSVWNLTELQASADNATRRLDDQSYAYGAGYWVSDKREDGNHLTFNLKLRDGPGTPYGDDIQELAVNVWQDDDDMVRVKISDKNNANRWEVPSSLYERGDISKKPSSSSSSSSSSRKYEVKFESSPFSFKVVRKEDNYPLFDSSALPLVFKDQYIQIGTFVNQDVGIYGLGETTRDSMRINQGDKHTLWTRDITASLTNVNLYGAHPFYYALTGQGKSHGVFLLNSNGMDITREHDKLVYQAIGGVFDFFIMVGSTPAAVMNQYTSLIGRPKMQPYWSFGFHQCRWGYKNTDVMREVVRKYAENQIPLDTMWNDIDFMKDFYDFVIGNGYTPESLKSFVDDLHAQDLHYVPIVDPGIPQDGRDPAYARGNELDIFIKNQYNQQYLGQVWPGPTVFPDFLHPDSGKYWQEQLQRLYNQIQYDGLWIDMNELANFCDGKMCERQPGECPYKGSLTSWTTCCLHCWDDSNQWQYQYPPFQINHVWSKDKLFARTVAGTARHYGGAMQYNTHNLNGFLESIATEKGLVAISKKRGFVLSRSTFSGSGSYVAHWTGDNKSTWNDLRYSIVSILNFGLFGIPMIGADICGFFESTNEELCARWTALGAFYPFSRNHNGMDFVAQETYVWKSVADVGRKFLGMRYQLLPYIYTLGYESHKTGMPIARPMFMEFPNDGNCAVWPAVDRQFFLGSSILVIPVLDQNAHSVEGYVPSGVWYHLFDHTRLESTGSKHQWAAGWLDMPVFIRGGSILAMHQVGALTTKAAREKPFELVVAASNKNSEQIKWSLFLDDGEEASIGDHATIVDFVAQVDASGMGSLSWSTSQNNYGEASSKTVRRVTVLGVTKKPSSVSAGTLLYNEDLGRLVIDLTGSKVSITQSVTVSWK